MEELKISKQRVIDAAASCSVAKEVLKKIFPEAFVDDSCAFLHDLNITDVAKVSSILFGSSDDLQLLSSGTPPGKPELNKRALWLNRKYKVEIGEALGGGSYIHITKR